MIPNFACATENKYTIISVEVIIMRFCDKLANLRRNNNITQEILADKLNVSRQAVSKWENGTSMPDMKTIMELCRILNCSLEDLIDDKALGNKVKKEEKFNFNNYLKEILDFITKTYNMFCSMKFKQKLKCLFEMSFLVLILYFGFIILGCLLSSFINPILWNLPFSLEKILHNILDSIYILIAIIFSIIIVIHLFKIRYLDYFITIYDDNVKNKCIEEAIEENKNKIIKEDAKKVILEHQKEKIIIRDPKHASYSFFNALGSLIVLFCKALAFVCGIFALISFIFLLFSFFVSAFYSLDGLIFLGITIIILSLVLLNFLVLYLLYTFIFEQKIKKYLFTGFIITLVLMAFGLSLTFFQVLSFKYVDNINNTTNIKTNVTYIEVDDKTLLSFLNSEDTEIIIDDKLADIKVELTSLNNTNIKLSCFQNNDGKDYFYINYYNDYIIDDFKSVINMLKNKEWYSDLSLIKVKVYVSSNNLNLLKNNFK